MTSKQQGNFVHTQVQMKLTQGAKVITTDSCLPFSNLPSDNSQSEVFSLFVCLLPFAVIVQKTVLVPTGRQKTQRTKRGRQAVGQQQDTEARSEEMKEETEKIVTFKQ